MASYIGISIPANAIEVTPHDTDELTIPASILYVGVAGDLTVILADDTAAVTIKAAAVGYHEMRVKVVKSTGTTAKNIIAFA